MTTHAKSKQTMDQARAAVAGQASPASQGDTAQTAAQQRNYAQELAAAVAAAFEQGSRPESVIVSSIRQRAELFEKAYVQAKQMAIDTVANDVAPAKRSARQRIELRKSDVEALAPESTSKFAALDARHYRELHDPEHRAQAALAMADTSHLSAAYRIALADRAPDIAAAVQIAMALTERTNEVKSLTAPSTPTQGIAAVRHSDRGAQPRSDRTREVDPVAQQLSLDGFEQDVDAKGPRSTVQAASQRTPRKHDDVGQAKEAPRPSGRNHLASDEVFTASQDGAKPIMPIAVEDKFLRVGAKYYHPKNTRVVAFEDKGNKLETQSNSEHIVETLVTIARARGWDEIKVTGSETFRRNVWLEAAARGMHVKGYLPNDVDRAELAKRSRDHDTAQLSRTSSPATSKAVKPETEHELTKVEEVDRAQKSKESNAARERRATSEDQQRARAFARKSSADAVIDHPDLAGAYAAVALMKKKTVADGLTPQQQAIVMARIEANVANSIERGELPRVTLKDQITLPIARNESREAQR